MTTRHRPLPRGRHDLSRAEVGRIQRDRILDGVAAAMAERGHVATSVADIIAHAGVSRETFYQQFASKAEAFDAALDVAGELLTAHLLATLDGAAEHDTIGAHDDDLRRRVARLVTAYLDAILQHRAHARLHLVEVWAAGAESLERRDRRRRELARLLASELGRDDPAGRFASEMIVAGLSTLVTVPLLAGDDEALLALAGPATDLTLRLLDPDVHARP